MGARILLTTLALAACADDDGLAVAPGHDAPGPDARGDAGEPSGDGAASDLPPAPLLPENLRAQFQRVTLDDQPGFATDFVFLPGTSEILLGEKSGRILHYALAGDHGRLLGSFTLTGVHDVLDCGLLSLAVDPGFASNRFLFAGLCTDGRHSGVYRYVFDPAGYAGIDATRTEIINVGDDAAPQPWHNVGALTFDADGNLWIPFGEKYLPARATDLTTDLGKIIRIVPSREPAVGGHQPAPGNPFIGMQGRSANIYALGARSPWRGLLDHRGRYWFGDVGSDFFEEINVITAAGANFGWNSAEGPCESGCTGLTEPLTSWRRRPDHPYNQADPEARPTGLRVGHVGIAYQDRGHDRYRTALTGRVVFGDFCVGFLRLAELDAGNQLVVDVPIGHLEAATGWQQGPDGFVYVSTFGACYTDNFTNFEPDSRLYRMVLR